MHFLSFIIHHKIEVFTCSIENQNNEQLFTYRKTAAAIVALRVIIWLQKRNEKEMLETIEEGKRWHGEN